MKTASYSSSGGISHFTSQSPPQKKIGLINYNTKYHFMNQSSKNSAQKQHRQCPSDQFFKQKCQLNLFQNQSAQISLHKQSLKSTNSPSKTQANATQNMAKSFSISHHAFNSSNLQDSMFSMNPQYYSNTLDLQALNTDKESIYMNNSCTNNEEIGEKIIGLCNQKIREDPENIKYYLKRQQQYLKSSQFDKAISDAEFILSREPSNISAMLSRGKAYMQQGMIEKALVDFERVLKLDPDNVNAALTKASCLNLKGDYMNAINQYEDALEKDFEKSSFINLSMMNNVKRSFKSDPQKVGSCDPVRQKQAEICKYSSIQNEHSKLNYLERLEQEELQVGLSQLSGKKPLQFCSQTTSASSSKKPSYVDYQQIIQTENNFGLNDGINKRKNQSNISSECPTPLLNQIGQYEPQLLQEGANEQANIYFTRGYLARQKGEFKKAIELYSLAITLNPHLLKAIINRGFLLDKLGEEEKAYQDYSQALLIDDHCSFAYFNRGITLDKLGKWKDAVQDFSKAIQIDPTNSDFYLNRGNALQKLECHSEAILDYTKCIDFQTDKLTSVLISRAISFEKRGNLEKARNDYERAVEQKSNQVHVCYSRMANICMIQGDHNQALLLCNKALEVQPLSVYCLAKRAQICCKLQLYQLANEDLTKAISINPQIASLYFSRGKVLKKMGMLIESIEDLLIALTIQPSNPNFLCLLGTSMMELGKYEEAVQYIDLEIQMIGASKQSLFNRSFCNCKLRKFNEAENDLRELLQYDPSDMKVKRALSICLYNQQKYKDAERLFSELLKEYPKLGSSEFLAFRKDCIENLQKQKKLKDNGNEEVPFFGGKRQQQQSVQNQKVQLVL